MTNKEPFANKQLVNGQFCFYWFTNFSTTACRFLAIFPFFLFSFFLHSSSFFFIPMQFENVHKTGGWKDT